MKTTSRKKMLISSVAMLLVAILALGTATFAWFTTDTSATADKLSVSTMKASELKLQSVSIDWTDTLHYNYTGKVLKPASSADGLNWYAATATSKSSYATTAANVTKLGAYSKDASGIANYVFMDQINVGNAGSADVENVTITATLSEECAIEGAEYLRMAIVPAAARGTSSGMATMTGTFSSCVYATTANDAANAINSSTTTGASGEIKTTAVTAAGPSISIDVGTLLGKTGTNTMGGIKYYNLYVWFEGQDEDCKDANAGNTMPEITFTVTGDTKDQTAAA